MMIRVVWCHVWLSWFPGRGVAPGRLPNIWWPLDGMVVCWSLGFVLVLLNDDLPVRWILAGLFWWWSAYPVGWYWSFVMVVCWSGGTVLAVLDGGLLA